MLEIGKVCPKGHLLTSSNCSLRSNGRWYCLDCENISYKTKYKPHPLIMLSSIDRFYRHVIKTNTCWIWKGSLSHNGYPQFRFDSHKQGRATRFIYEYYKGVIPQNYDIDHLCFNCKCVNPEHLEAVARKVNIKRMFKHQLELNKHKLKTERKLEHGF